MFFHHFGVSCAFFSRKKKFWEKILKAEVPKNNLFTETDLIIDHHLIFSKMPLTVLLLLGITQIGSACYNGIDNICRANETSECLLLPCLECNRNYVMTPDILEWQIIDDVPVKVNLGGLCECGTDDEGNSMLLKLTNGKGGYNWSKNEWGLDQSTLKKPYATASWGNYAAVCHNSTSISVSNTAQNSVFEKDFEGLQLWKWLQKIAQSYVYAPALKKTFRSHFSTRCLPWNGTNNN